VKCRLIRERTCEPSDQFPDGIQPVGAIIDHPQAFWLVRMGVAESADAECRERANRSPEQCAKAQKAYERLEAGIHPDDFAAYDAGLMRGYNSDGSWIPGPAYEEEDEDYELTEDDFDE